MKSGTLVDLLGMEFFESFDVESRVDNPLLYKPLDLNIRTALVFKERKRQIRPGVNFGDRSIQLRMQGPHLRGGIRRVQERPHRAT